MTTTTLHANLQRSRFAHHALATLAALAPFALKTVKGAPARSAVETAAIEAQNVRDMAYTYLKTDPGFAADLYAAAARHESLHEG
jgi:hypothetical protein